MIDMLNKSIFKNELFIIKTSKIEMKNDADEIFPKLFAGIISLSFLKYKNMLEIIMKISLTVTIITIIIGTTFKIESVIKTQININLSASGSKTVPKSVTILNFLAT